MTPRAYIGITGPVNIQETRFICSEFSEAGYSMDSPHIPMLGFLVSYKTLNGQSVQNRRYPKLNEIPNMLTATEGKVFTMIHYNSKEMDSLSDQVAKIFEGIYENNLCRAIQLNIVWPNLKEVETIKAKYPDMQIVFQASHKAMEGKTPKMIAEGIKTYGDALNYVLIDPSGGRGLEFDLKSSVLLYTELKEHCPDLCIGFAGGFNGENVALKVEDLIKEIKSGAFCIDAEGGLRDKLSSEYGDDLLNIEKVKKYLQYSSLVLK